MTTTKENPMGLFRKEDKRCENASGALTYTSGDKTHVVYYNSADERDRKVNTLRLFDIKARDVRSS